MRYSKFLSCCGAEESRSAAYAGVKPNPAPRTIHRDTSPREMAADTPTGMELDRVIAEQVRKCRRASGMSVGDMAAPSCLLLAITAYPDSHQG